MSQNAETSVKRIHVLGCTGSIGTNTLDVLQHLGAGYEIVGLAASRSVESVIDQARQFDVRHIAMADEEAGRHVAEALGDAAKVYRGPEAQREMVETVEADMIIAAVVGAAGLPATAAAIQRGMHVGLANKETLVTAGEWIMPMVQAHGVELLPVDSEHSAIYQCLAEHQRTAGHSEIRRIVLTASGGPFRNATLEQMHNATVDQALAHPTWNMGPKITIDSATMMNKALEIIEAHWLFGLRSDQIRVIIHPQSIVHSFVEFCDNSVLAQLGPPDMRTPIQYALTHPQRHVGCSRAMDWDTLSKLDFEQPDFDRFESLKLAYRVIDAGGTSGAVLNAANEAAVQAFLDRKIGFTDIVQLVEAAMDAIDPVPVTGMEVVLQADREARNYILNKTDAKPASAE